MAGKKTEAKVEAGREIIIERVQTGVRLEKRLLKVLKAMAEYHDMTLGDLLEGIVLHAFDGKPAFGEESLGRIAEFKRLYHLDLDASASHRLQEREGESAARKSAGKGKAGRKKER
jgi:predicted DNA-binding ribbon-helix-helix protein